MGRSTACYDPEKSVVVKIVDSCPCVHQNFYSNQRWCCGDAAHIDLSHDVFKMVSRWTCFTRGLLHAASVHRGRVLPSGDQAALNPADPLSSCDARSWRPRGWAWSVLCGAQ